MENIETIINTLNTVIDQIDKPISICSNEQSYIQAEIRRIGDSFFDQQVGTQIEGMLRSALRDVVYSADQLINAQESIKRIILNCSSK